MDLALSKEPDNFMVLEYKALLLTYAGEHATSLDYYDRALATGESETVMLGKAISLFHLGRDQAAYGYIDRVLNSDPSNELALYLRDYGRDDIAVQRFFGGLLEG